MKPPSSSNLSPHWRPPFDTTFRTLFSQPFPLACSAAQQPAAFIFWAASLQYLGCRARSRKIIQLCRLGLPKVWPPSSTKLFILPSYPWLRFPSHFPKCLRQTFYFSQTYSARLQTHPLSSDDLPAHCREDGLLPGFSIPDAQGTIFTLILASPLPTSQGLFFTGLPQSFLHLQVSLPLLALSS